MNNGAVGYERKNWQLRGVITLEESRQIHEQLVRGFHESRRNRPFTAACVAATTSPRAPPGLSPEVTTAGDAIESAFPKSSIVNTPPVSLVTTPPEPTVIRDEPTTRSTRSRTTKVPARKPAVEKRTLKNSSTGIDNGRRRTKRRNCWLPIGLEKLPLGGSKPEKSAVAVAVRKSVVETASNNEHREADESTGGLDAASDLFTGNEPRRGLCRPKRKSTSVLNYVADTESSAVPCVQSTTDFASDLCSAAGAINELSSVDTKVAVDGVAVDGVEVEPHKRRSRRLNASIRVKRFQVPEPFGVVSALPSTPLAATSPDDNGTAVATEIDDVDAKSSSEEEAEEEMSKRRGRRPKNQVVKALKKPRGRRVRKSEPVVAVTSDYDDDQVEAVEQAVNNTAVGVCPQCPDVPCTRDHLLAVHNNIHPDEYLTLRCQRSERKKRWAESTQAGYKLRCQNPGCTKTYTTPEGLQYHLTEDGLCLEPASRRRTFLDNFFVEDTPTVETPIESVPDAGGRCRRSAAVKAELQLKKVLDDERKSDRKVEAEAACGDVAEKLKKRRRPDDSQSTSSLLSFSSRSDDDAYSENKSLFSSSSESDNFDDLDDEKDDDSQIDAENADDAQENPFVKKKKLNREKKLFENKSHAGRTNQSLPSKSRRRMDSHLMPRIYERITQLLWQTHENMQLRRPAEKLRKMWAQTINLIGVCVCRVCSHESLSVDDAFDHFNSCEKLNEMQSNFEVLYLPDEYEIRSVNQLLQCRLCSYAEEGCGVEHVKSMTKHCARFNGPHSALINNNRFQSLVRDVLASCKGQMDPDGGWKRRDLADKVANAAMPFLCNADQRQQMLNAESKFGHDRMKEKHAAYRANIALLQRARQQVAALKLFERIRPVAAGDRDEPMQVEDSDVGRTTAIKQWIDSHAPAWLSRMHSQNPDLLAWRSICNLNDQAIFSSASFAAAGGYIVKLPSNDRRSVNTVAGDVFSPTFCVTSCAVDDNQIASDKADDGEDGGSAIRRKKNRLKLFDVLPISATHISESSFSDDSSVHFSFIGGRVAAVCWLPQIILDAENSSISYQLLALTIEAEKLQSSFANQNASSSNSDKNENLPHSFENDALERCIQFWRVRSSTTDEDSTNIVRGKLEFAGAITSDFGTVRALAFLPLSQATSSTNLGDNFTLLAAATDSGICAVYLLNLASLTQAESSKHYQNLSPFLLLCLPRQILDANDLLPKVENTAEVTLPDDLILKYEPHKFSSLAWLPVADRNEILVGGDDGLIAIFRLGSEKLSLNFLCRKVRLNTQQQPFDAAQLFPIATINFGRGLISQVHYCFLNKTNAVAEIDAESLSTAAVAAEQLQVFVTSRESKLAFYISHHSLLQQAAHAAACGGGDSALIASSAPYRAVPVYWRTAADHSHLVSCLSNTSPQTVLDNDVMGGIFTAYGDAQIMSLTRTNYLAPPSILRKQFERVLNSAIRPKAVATAAADAIDAESSVKDDKSTAATTTSDDTLAEKISYAVNRMRKNILSVNAAAHQQSFTALALTGDTAMGSAAAHAYPCLASADQIGNVYLNDMLLAARAAIQLISQRVQQTDEGESASADRPPTNVSNTNILAVRGRIDEGFEDFAVRESNRRNAWRNQPDRYKPLGNVSWMRRALLTTKLVDDGELDSSDGGKKLIARKFINFRLFPTWNVEAMSEAETLERGKKDLDERAELMLGRENELGMRSVSKLSWCPTTQRSTDESGGAKPNHLLVFNEAGFMILFDRNLL